MPRPVLRVVLLVALSAATATSASTVRVQPDIRADTNRNRVVDITGNSDVHGKYLWSRYRGAIFLPNIGDGQQRCAELDARGNPLSNSVLAACNDAWGDDAISPEYFAPLRTMPLADIGDHVHAISPRSQKSTFPTCASFGWNTSMRIGRSSTPSFASTPRLFALGSRSGWTRAISLVSGHDAVDTDEVALTLAPVLFHYHLRAVGTLLTQSSNQSSNAQKRFVAELDAARAKTAVAKPLLTLPDGDLGARHYGARLQFHAWAGRQTHFDPRPRAHRPELAYGWATGVYKVARQRYWRLPTDGKGTFGFREVNSGGNIETMPPYVSKVTGEAYPTGPIVTGKHHELLPAHAMLTYYKSQQLQSPLILETGWLVIGHVDEFLSFLPANNSLGFTISIADPLSALEILRQANASGHGAASAYSVGPSPDPPLSLGRDRRLDFTIADVLSGPETCEQVQQYADKYIQANLAVLLAETGLSEADVVRIPTLFVDSSQQFFQDGFAPWDPPGSPPHYTVPEPNGRVLLSFYPAAINGVVIGRSYIGARAFGPVINSTDILQTAVDAAYQRAGMDAHFIDDFYSHHSMGGEVHCGTNTFRETAVRWW